MRIRAGALFNAVKKQYGLHSYLLRLALPSPSPPPVPVPALIPRLPPPPSNDDGKEDNGKKVDSSGLVLNTLRMGEEDIQHTARFTREFVVQSLVPWMEKCVNDWNEIVHNNLFLLSSRSPVVSFLVLVHATSTFTALLIDSSSLRHVIAIQCKSYFSSSERSPSSNAISHL